MDENIPELTELYGLLSQIEGLSHALKILNYDLETAAPEGGMEDDGKNMTDFSAMAFKITKSKKYIGLVKTLKEEKYASLSPFDQRLVKELYQDMKKEEHIGPKLQREESNLFNQAYATWLKAKNDNSYAEFAPTLKNIYKMEKKVLLKREDVNPENLYNSLIGDYEEGFTTEDLDRFFDDLEKGIIPLLNKVRAATYVPRHDFLTRSVPIAKQEKFTAELLTFNGFDFRRGSVATTMHPFTDEFGQNDVRVTTHYYENNFISNMYSIIHEGGHALFGQNLPKECFDHHIAQGYITMAKHESVSRFYENVIGRSEAYINAIYPKFQEIFHDELGDVSAHDFYEGVNWVDLANPLRTEADELTYTLHIIIRYGLEKEIMSGKANFRNLNKEWNRLYQEILGITNTDDKTGILQDVHWSSGFGYFPTYAMGNALNCIYVKALDKEIGLAKTVSEGHMDQILAWMKEHVFKTATLFDTKEWIHNISGEEFSAKPYLDYLTAKYTELYHLN